MIYISAYKLQEQFGEHLGQLETERLTEVTQVTDEEGTKMHVPHPVEYLAFESKDDMVTKLFHALDCAIIETDKQEVI